jgi:hypothetical protein
VSRTPTPARAATTAGVAAVAAASASDSDSDPATATATAAASASATDAATATASDSDPATATAAAAASASDSATATATATAAASDSDSDSGTGSGLLRMRRGGEDRGLPSANLTLDPHSREEIAGHGHSRDDNEPHDTGEPGADSGLRDPRAANFTGPTLTLDPPKVDTFGKLENTPGGGAVIDDRVTTVTMEPDGNIKFDDKPDIDIKLKLPIPRVDIEGIREDLGKLITVWYRDPYAGTRFGPKSEVARHLTAVPGTCDHWGDVMCDDPLAPESEKRYREQKKTNGSILGGPMDITAWLHRKLIGDPYASRKIKLLDMTRDERIARGGVYRGEQLDRSAELMTRTLEELWATTSGLAESTTGAGSGGAAPTAHEVAAFRKEALFELWDECAEGEGPRGEAGQRARAVVIGWIRGKLPAGSPEAFTDEDIFRFQSRRSSKQPFVPY